MAILRILLVLGLLVGCFYIAARAPWVARLDPTGFFKKLEDAPLWARPAAPPLESFPGFMKGAGIPEGTEIVVELERRRFFGRACVTIVGLFFLFGFVGTLIQRRPESSDVAFSLWLSLGLMLGILTSATIGHLSNAEQFPFFSECLLAGFIIGLWICVKSQTRLPFAKRRKRRKDEDVATH